jgi:peptide-methionine (S)-S-oxide reductase
MQKIVLGGGCFWCLEAIFQRIDGVVTVTSGYAGGYSSAPSYSLVSTGSTGHAEVVKVEFNQERITLQQILEIFFLTHDPTTLNRQGADVGSQYRSIILYKDEEQKQVIDDVIKKEQAKYEDRIVTEVKLLEEFYKAEEKHIDYYNKHPEEGYCRIVIEPKLEKVLSKHKHSS